MDKFMGKCKPVAELTEGMDAYILAMKLSEEASKTVRNNMNNLVSSMTKAGEGINTAFNDYGDWKEEYNFQLGVPMITKVVDMETKNTFTLNGDRLDGVHEIGGQSTTTSRYFQGDLLVFESEGNGAKMKTFFKKISD